jgi:cephalosporin hydroxylase
MMSKIWDVEFQYLRKKLLGSQSNNLEFKAASRDWMQLSVDNKYSYQFDWLGVPIIQMPEDLIIFQEIVYKTQPDLIIETGVARGGSIIFWASIQRLCGITGKVLGVDIEIRQHARSAINNSNFKNEISLIEGSSIEDEVVDQVKKIVSRHKRIMVVLDSNHTHEHVLSELEIYSKFVSKDCFLIVLDTVIDDLKVDPTRPWGPGSSPKSAVKEFMLKTSGDFINEQSYENRALLSVAPNGYLRRN